MTIFEPFIKVRKSKIISLVLVFLFFIIIFSTIYLTISKTVGLDDPYFHIKFAEQIREKGVEVINNFQWIYFSEQARSMSRYYVSLFHFILIPFTFFSELWLGIKIFGIIAASVLMATIYWWLKKLNIKYAFYLLLLFWSLWPAKFGYRILTARPFVIMMLITLFELYFIWKKKYFWFFIFCIFHIFTHQSTFYIPLFLAMVFVAFEYLHKKRIDLKLILTGFFATIIGMATMPNFPSNIYKLSLHLISIYQAVWQKEKVIIPEGNELFGNNIIDFFTQNYIFIGLIIFFLILRITFYLLEFKNKEKRFDFFDQDKDLLILADSLFFINLAYLVGFLLTSRVMDIWIPLVLIYIALMLKILIKKIQFNIADSYKKTLKISFTIFSVIMIVYLLSGRAFYINSAISNQSSPIILKGSTEWLKQNTNNKDIIFLDDWSYFPLMYYYNEKNYYTVGMEPRFLYDYDKKLYFYWYNIVFRGLPCDQFDCNAWEEKIKGKKDKELIGVVDKDIAEVIINNFESKYVFISNGAGSLQYIAKNSEYFTEVYRDPEFRNFAIFKINEDKLHGLSL